MKKGSSDRHLQKRTFLQLLGSGGLWLYVHPAVIWILFVLYLPLTALNVFGLISEGSSSPTILYIGLLFFLYTDYIWLNFAIKQTRRWKDHKRWFKSPFN